MAGTLLVGGLGFAVLPVDFTTFVEFIRGFNLPTAVTAVFKVCLFEYMIYTYFSLLSRFQLSSTLLTEYAFLVLILPKELITLARYY